MANTIRPYTGDGTTVLYNIDFTLGYIRKAYVYVYLEGNLYTDQLAYTYINDTQIQLTTPVANGTVFNIRRVVPRDSIVNDYEDGASLQEENLDDSFKQAIMALEEIQDGYTDPSGTFSVNTDLDMLNNKIVNLGAAVNPNDAVRLVDAEALAGVGGGGSTISEVPPVIKVAGERWTRCSDMKAFLWYVDVDGGQWIEDRPSYGVARVFQGVVSNDAVNNSLFRDSLDDKLKYKDSGGVVNLLY